MKSTKGKLKPDSRLSAELVDTVVTNQRESLHSLRKQIKRVRYQLKLVSEFYGDRLEADLKKLADLQTVLGTLQDSLVMESLLSQVLPAWETQLPTLKALLAASRHQAWKQWQSLQEYYLDSSHRETLRSVLGQPGTEKQVGSAQKTKTPSAKTSKSRRKSSAAQSTKSSSRQSGDSSTPENSTKESDQGQ